MGLTITSVSYILKMIRSFDIETFNDGDKLVPYCVSFCDDTHAKTFYGLNCVENFIMFLFDLSEKRKKTKKKAKFYIFSHNLTFDGSIILQNIKIISGVKFSGIFFKGSIYTLTLTKDDIVVTFKCSYKFFPNSLEKANNMLDTNKKKEYDHTIVNIFNYILFKNVCESYCINDAFIVIQIMKHYEGLIKNYLPNWLESTHSIPSVSIKMFDKCFNKFNAKTFSTLDIDTIFRSSYYGGRCEVFGNPKPLDKIYHFDFTGMYAQVMLESYSTGDHEIIQNPCNITNNGFFHVEAESDMYIPVLPHHDKTGALLFTNGHITGLYWWEELALFILKGGKIKKINYHIKFNDSACVFENFVSSFTKLRTKSKQLNIICKSVINSLYGRLGMGPMETSTKLMYINEWSDFQKINEKNIVSETVVNNVVIVEMLKKRNDNDSLSSNVALASMITSKARIKLYKAFCDVTDGGGRILYTDTDSIFAAFEKNVDNCKFGDVWFDMSKNDTRLDDAVFAAPKAYATIINKVETVKIKGAKRNSISFNNFKNAFKSENNIKLSVDFLKKSNYVITPSNIEKIINFKNYTKRTFRNKKINTTPLKKCLDGSYENTYIR